MLSGNGQDPWTRAEGSQPLSHPLPAGTPGGIRAPTENELREDLLSLPSNVAELGSLQTPGGDVSMLNTSGHREPQAGRQDQVMQVVRASCGPSKATPPRSRRDDLLHLMCATLEGRRPAGSTVRAHLVRILLWGPCLQTSSISHQASKSCASGMGLGSTRLCVGVFSNRSELPGTDSLCQLVRLTHPESLETCSTQWKTVINKSESREV